MVAGIVSERSPDGVPVSTLLGSGRPMRRRQRMARLLVLSGPDRSREFIIDRRRCSGGRSIISDIRLEDTSVAGSHFEILAREDGYRLRDLDTDGGTYVGDVRIREVYVRSGLEFRVGDTALRFELLPDFVDIELSKQDRFDSVVGTSAAMREIFAQLEKVAPSNLTCMLMGETGVGKERLARAIHNASHRRSRPFVVLDCGSLPSQLIESTLFGHEKGSFSGAIGQYRGCFEQAQGGTIFLDEIGELDVALQPKLLRVIEEREIKRIGGSRIIDVDVRVLAATNRDLRAEINLGNFREDLYYRLSVVSIEVPPLRNRREDLPIIASQFLREAASRRGMTLSFASDALAALHAHSWPGNVRELHNVVERAAALCDGPEITCAELAFGGRHGAASPISSLPAPPFKKEKQRILRAFEAEYLKALIERNGGNLSQAARESGLTRYHLRELLKRHQLRASQREPH